MPRGGTTFCPVLWQAFQEKVKQAWLHHPILRHSWSFFVSEKNPSISTSTRLFSLPFVLQIPKIFQDRKKSNNWSNIWKWPLPLHDTSCWSRINITYLNLKKCKIASKHVPFLHQALEESTSTLEQAARLLACATSKCSPCFKVYFRESDKIHWKETTCLALQIIALSFFSTSWMNFGVHKTLWTIWWIMLIYKCHVKK